MRGYDIRTVQELLGHRNVRSTVIYTLVLNRAELAVHSPLDLAPRRAGVRAWARDTEQRDPSRSTSADPGAKPPREPAEGSRYR